MNRVHPFRFGRRSFVRITAGSAAGLYLAGCDGSSSEPIEPVRALVIGSGFGGSIAALRLAEAGINVTVLERGKRWEISEDRDTFTTTQAPDGRSAWLHINPVIPGSVPIRLANAPFVGLLQKFTNDSMDVVCAAAVGGGSLVYSGLMLKPPQPLFESVFPSNLSYSELDSIYYPRVREIMRPGALPDDILEAPEYVSSRLFIEGAEAAGLDVERNEVALDWEGVRAELRGDVPPQAILGDYLLGLNSGAKRSVDMSDGYLGMAEATGMVDVRPQHQVIAIEEAGEGGYLVRAEQLDESGESVGTVTFAADCVFLAAGSMNTTKLLLQAQRAGTLPNLNDRVGHAWGNNGQRIQARGNMSQETGAFQGGPANIFVHHHDNPHGPIGMEFGPAPLAFEHNCLISATQGVPDQLAQVVLDAEGQVQVQWDDSYDAAAGRAADHTLSMMAEAHGGESVLPFAGLERRITFHPLGGATMGEVCDTYGRVQGHPHLYVVDSALIPGSTPAGNPFWTIAAIAERCMDEIIATDLQAETTRT